MQNLNSRYTLGSYRTSNSFLNIPPYILVRSLINEKWRSRTVLKCTKYHSDKTHLSNLTTHLKSLLSKYTHRNEIRQLYSITVHSRWFNFENKIAEKSLKENPLYALLKNPKTCGLLTIYKKHNFLSPI